ncbi:hypothetical protein CHELA20_53204 [Hyphomicrobiales bacterium]|nr:hypothetical protein CHELA41_21719 [Hyphomicrobiales bacterium]CAH1683782.1 hypothetical protein CHELA20_53204 [Hyphomicrobiales bacterium]
MNTLCYVLDMFVRGGHKSGVSPMNVATEFDAFLARAGLSVSADRREAMIAGYEDLRKRVALLRQKRKPSSAPCSVFSVDVRRLS